MVFLAFPFRFASVVGRVILIIIAAESFQRRKVLGRVLTILYFCWSPLSFIPVGHTRTLFLSAATAGAFAGAEGSTRHLSKREVDFVVLAIAGDFVQGIFRVVIRFVVEPILYDEWVRRFIFVSAEDSEERFAAKWNRLFNGLTERVFTWALDFK